MEKISVFFIIHIKRKLIKIYEMRDLEMKIKFFMMTTK